jgi:DNA-directed RNA polymerases I and III subunit RPAC2
MSGANEVKWNPENMVNPPSATRLTIPHCHPDRTAATFAIRHEDHTLGNALRHVLMQNEHVELAGYSVPHPSEPVVHIRVQTHSQTKLASHVLQEACHTVSRQCDHVLQQLEELLPYVKEDRIRMEQFLEEQNEEEDDDDMNVDSGV